MWKSNTLYLERGFAQLLGMLRSINCWKIADNIELTWNLYDLEDKLKEYGWQVPAYPLPKDLDDVTISRIVVRPAMTMAICDDFIDDLHRAIDDLNSNHLIHHAS